MCTQTSFESGTDITLQVGIQQEKKHSIHFRQKHKRNTSKFWMWERCYGSERTNSNIALTDGECQTTESNSTTTEPKHTSMKRITQEKKLHRSAKHEGYYVTGRQSNSKTAEPRVSERAELRRKEPNIRQDTRGKQFVRKTHSAKQKRIERTRPRTSNKIGFKLGTKQNQKANSRLFSAQYPSHVCTDRKRRQKYKRGKGNVRLSAHKRQNRRF